MGVFIRRLSNKSGVVFVPKKEVLKLFLPTLYVDETFLTFITWNSTAVLFLKYCLRLVHSSKNSTLVHIRTAY